MSHNHGRKNAMTKAIAHNFHVPLPDTTYQRLKIAAKRQKRPATQVVKQAIDYWLDEQERLILHEQIAEYAAHTAGNADDLDETLEAAAMEHLTISEKKR
jgi:predicted DNA-binding protein